MTSPVVSLQVGLTDILNENCVEINLDLLAVC